jgi:glycosyltransferase 2 family protein
MMLKSKKAQGVLQIIISASLLSWLIWQAGPQEVAKTLSSLRWGWYLPAFFLFLTNIIIRTYRWYILLSQLNNRPTFPHLVFLYFFGFFANNFIPSGFGSDVIKVVGLRQRYGRGAEALSSVLMDRLTGLLGSALFALIALLWHSLTPTSKIDLPAGLLTAVALISIGIPGSFIFIRWTKPINWLIVRLPILQRVPKLNKIEEVADTLQRYPFSSLFRALLTSLPFTLTLILIQFLIARAVAVDLPITVFALFVPIISIINLLPISFNGLGTRDVVYQLLFIPLGVLPATAVAMSLAFYFLRFGAGLIGGILYAVKGAKHITEPSKVENLS